jgi:PAS domain S-box-containing protein
METERSARIVVVDDDSLVVESLELLLSSRWEVLTATSAAEARALLDAHEVAVLICDERMPGESGVELFAWAVDHHPSTLRILLTGYADFSTVIKAINGGKVWHFIRKPWSNQELLSLVQRAVEFRAQSFELARSERRYRELFHHAHVGVVSCTLDGRVCEANPAFVDSLGLDSPDDAVDLDLRERLVEPAAWPPLVERLRGERSVRDVELLVLRRGAAPVRLLFNASLRTVDGAARIDAATLDVTEQRRAGDEQRALRQQLENLHRLEIGAMLGAGAVHDLNNLLTVVLGSASYLAVGAVPADETAECLGEIEGAARKAGELTGQLMGFLRGGGAREPADCNLLARETAQLLRRTADRRVTIVAALDPAAPRALVDAPQVHQCLMNLCVNACDAMAKRGGTLTIRTATRELSAAEGDHALSPGRYVVVRVEDTGEGIAPSVLARIFEPFFTTKTPGARSGTGLGLALVDSIVRQRGGAVEVESVVGQGTAVTLLLPAVRFEAPDAAREPGRHSQVGETVLFVDDEPALRVLASRSLRPLGYRVVTATDGRHALEVAQATPHVSVAVLDLVMPVLGGVEALALLREHDPSLRFVLTTGYAIPWEQREILTDPSIVLLRKPYSVDQLAAAVRQSLARA